MSWFAQELAALAHQFFPSLCLHCNCPLPNAHAIGCVTCQANWAYTDLHQFRDNAFTERFWGRIPLVHGAAMFHFLKGGATQQLVHALKYKGKQYIGVKLGKAYGLQLKAHWASDLPDWIIPVPLHPRKLHERGYNQAEVIARGLSLSMQVRVLKKVLIRTNYMASQTQMSRAERMENVLASFAVRQGKKLEGKHLLLVDDVLTTGATLEACALQLQKIPNVRISMATLAIAQI